VAAHNAKGSSGNTVENVEQRWSRSRSAGVDSGRSLQFLPKPEQWSGVGFFNETGPGAGARVGMSVFTEVG